MPAMPDWNVIAAAIFMLIVSYFILRIFSRPLKLVLSAMLQMLLGGAAIILYNLLGAAWGITVGLNIITALIVGIMGLPGLGMLIALQYIFG